MYPYTKYYIKVQGGTGKDSVSDLIAGEFAAAEAINKFMSIHFPDNRAYLPLEEEAPKKIGNKIHKVVSIDTDIGKMNKMWVLYSNE